MFSREQLKTITGNDLNLSDEMAKRLQLWEDMLIGKAPWIELEKSDGVRSLGLEGAICQEFANVVLSEMETNIEDEQIQEIYVRMLQELNQEFQDGLALGSFAVKPIANTGKFEFVSAGNIIPLEFDSEGRLTRAVFIQVKQVGQDYYYRAEEHYLLPEGLLIRNRAFKGTKNNIGNQIPLSSITEWANLIPEIMYKGMDRLDFGYFKTPIKNRIDRSHHGVSIYNGAIHQIKVADIQFGRLDWEFESAERAIFADYTAVRRDGTVFRMPKRKERLFVGIDPENGQAIDTFSPQMREQSFINGLNEYKRQIEFNCCLAYGDLSKNETVEKTAMEIKSSKLRKYNMVNAIQTKLKGFLEDFAYAVAFYQAKYTQDIGFSCNFHDSILTDEETERNQDRIDMASGTMSRLEYRMKWYGEDEETARQKLNEIMDISSIDENQ